MRAGSTLLAVTAGAIGIAIGAFVRHATMIGEYAPREIVGTILDRAGVPVEGARVELRDVSDPVNNDLASSRATDRVTISDAHGEFRLRTKDDCVLVVTKSGFAPADVWQAREFMDPITIRLDAGRTFRARVVAAETDQPIVGARVVIASFDLVGGTRSAVTGDDGRIQIDDLPTLPSIEYVVIRKDAFAVRDSVDLPANPSSEVVLEVGSGPTFRGRVIDSSTGQPIVDAVIFDANIVGNSVLADRIEVARSTSDGTFTLAGAMFDGFWRLMIVKDGFVPSGIDFEEAGMRVTVGASESPTAKTVRLEKGFHGNTGTDVTSGEWLEPGFVLDVGLVPACAITGTMRRSNGLPVSDAKFLLVQSPDAQSLSALTALGITLSPGTRIGSLIHRTAVSDDDGRFRLDGLAPGHRGGFLFAEIDGMSFQRDPPTIESLRGTVDLEWTIPDQTATVFGIVRVGGKLVPNVRVEWGSTTWGASGSTATNSKGEFRFDAVTPGEIQLIHRLDDGSTARTVTITIAEGTPSRIDLDS